MITDRIKLLAIFAFALVTACDDSPSTSDAGSVDASGEDLRDRAGDSSNEQTATLDGGAGSMDARPPDLADASNAPPPCGPGSTRINVNSLLGEMTDLGALARRSLTKFRTYEASSYDRLSVTPQVSSEIPDGWYANMDWGHYLRVDETPRGSEHVMLDTEGPGAIVRIWTANGQEGTLRIYLDDMDTPVITADFVSLLSGQVAPFSSPFAVINSTGRNFDFPLPFRGRAKVTVTGSANIPAKAYFYQVFYRRYEKCADVETFRQDTIASNALESAKSTLTSTAGVAGLTMAESPLDSAKSSLEIQAADGGSEIVQILIRPDSLETANLRQTTLSMSFDGHNTVLAPLGDFFGAGPGLLSHRTLPLEVRSDGTLISRFVMPFSTKATITLGLTAGHTATVQVGHRARAFDETTFHFFAHWTARGPIPSRPYRDLLLADIDGEGAYVGTMLSHDDLSAEWWGEGDEKIWVDGETFPSLFGTGTEDYFGYAYSSRDPFDHPYRMARPTGQSRGQLTNARFHVLDVIRFDRSLRFNMEEWHWDPTTTVFFDTVVYFYGKPTTIDKLDQPKPADFRLPSQVRAP